MRTIALDAMGGDHGPAAAVQAAGLVSMGRGPSVLLVGDERRISTELGRVRHDPARIGVHHAPDAVGMDESPKAAIRRPGCSIRVAAELVAEGQADALVSAGNTGASILACAKAWKKLPGVPRTALAAVFPTERRRGEKDDPFSLILDVGATLHVDARSLVAFAHMGSAYAARISRNRAPRVALLSNGHEPNKGLPEIVEAHRILSKADGLNFIGNIEGVDLPRGTADVVVTGGFVGNVVLKMIEGISETVVDIARYAYGSRLTWRLGLMMLESGVKQLKEVTDWRQYGGAPILGFDHLFIKAHGRSGAQAIANAIKVANKAVDQGLVEAIRERVGAEVDADELPADEGTPVTP
jgi:glycerol-3-phosphate acyltransferase PlsX